jgi:hypothetical protein
MPSSIMARFAWGVARFATSTQLLAVALLPSNVSSQESLPVSSNQRATRADLSNRLAILERDIARGSGTKSDVNARARTEMEVIRTRLQTGDFRVGDRFVITVRQDSVRTDTASVRDSLKVAILNMPDVSLIGVLRSELDERISAHVSRYLKNVTTRTNVLTRIAIIGAVRSPGFYYTSPDRPITDVVMLAGGPAPEANLNEFEAVRGTTTIVKAKVSRRLIKEGKTLEQLDVQSGDEIRIPAKRRINWQYVFQLFFILTTLFFSMLQFLQWYYSRQDA